MAIRSDSFSSVDEVKGYTRHLLDGHSTFDTSTRPTLTEVEKFIDRSSALLNVALAAAGFQPSTIYANAVAKLACDDWVTTRAVKYVELTQRGTGYNADEGSRTAAFENDTAAFIDMMTEGFVNLGIEQGYSSTAAGLQFTAMETQSTRADRSDTTKEQPLFNRKEFDNT